MKTKTLAAITVILGVASVASLILAQNTVPDSVAKAASYPPKPTNYKQQVRAYMHVTLKDPDSAQYQHWVLAKGYSECKPPVYGWIVSVQVNAKNGFGAFTGYQPQLFWLHGHDLIKSATELPYKLHTVEVDQDELMKELHL